MFIIGEELFPVTVDYNRPITQSWCRLRARATWWGDIALSKIKRCFGGVHKVDLYYVTLKREDHLWEWGGEFEREGIILADAHQFFAFGMKFMRTEVTKEKTSPIVALGPGSIWRCSHDILIEAPGMVWDCFYHSPGPKVHTEFAPFQKGTRILAVKE